MYLRMVSLVTSPGKREQLSRLIEKEIAPLVQKQPGFVGHMTLTSETDPRLVTVMSFWRRKTDAELFRETVYHSILESLNPLLETEPVVTAFQRFPSGAEASENGKVLIFPSKE
jgi:heme-degrading monooxygenase HmoA